MSKIVYGLLAVVAAAILIIAIVNNGADEGSDGVYSGTVQIPASGQISSAAASSAPQSSSESTSASSMAASSISSSSAVSSSASSETSSVDSSLKQMIDLAISIAQNEPQFPVDESGATKYGKLFGTPKAQWCTEFVMYCLKQAETELGTEYIGNAYPWRDSAYATGLWFKSRNRYFDIKRDQSDYIPSPGDIIIFDTVSYGYPDHTGLVARVENQNGNWFVITIEGNIPQDSVKQIRSRKIPVNDPTIMAYCSPTESTPYTGSLDDYTR